MSKSALNMQSAIVHNSIKEQGGQVLIIHPGWVQSYMRGALDEKATLTAEDSAAEIMCRISEHKKYAGESTAFIYYNGERKDF